MKLFFNSNDAFVPKMYLYQYSDNLFRLVLQKKCRLKGFEEQKKDDTYIPKTDSEEIERISLSRTKRNIKEIALCNGFTHFATLTINSERADRFSLQECQDLLKYTIHEKIKRKNKDFAYIFITEKHKNGAFHFHGLVKNLDFYTNEQGYLSNEAFDEIGFNSFSEIRDFSRTCNYITKYITKDCIRNENNQIYISSKGLKKALKYDVEPFDFKFNYENDFCKIRDFDLNYLSQNELLKLMSIKSHYDYSYLTFFKFKKYDFLN